MVSGAFVDEIKCYEGGTTYSPCHMDKLLAWRITPCSISRRARDSAVRYHRSNRLLFRSDESLEALYKINICKCHETSLGEDCTYRLAERVKHFGLNSPILEHETL